MHDHILTAMRMMILKGIADVQKGLDPKRFTVRTVPALIAKSSAWKDYDKATRPLLPVLKKLAGR